MISDKQYLDLLQGLEEHHAIFYQLWEMGRPLFTDDVDTAAVGFDLAGQHLSFKFNPHFWEQLNDDSRLFVIAHEALHVLLNHHARSGGATDPIQQRYLNIAMDVTVNTQLIKRFGFRRHRLDDIIAQGGCFKDTVFGNDWDLKYKHFEYFYRQLATVDLEDLAKLAPFDDHSDFHHIPDNVVDEIADRAGRELGADEIDDLNQALQEGGAGDSSPMTTIIAPPQEVDLNPAWAEVIDEWVEQNAPTVEVEERWDRPPRRLQSMGQSFFIPREVIVEDFDKPRVVFYVDTSGSCKKFGRRFIRCIDSIPQTIFDVDLYCFDIQVHPIDRDDRKLFGFGGTSFYPLERNLRNQLFDGIPYPQAIFVLTDGYGNPIDPKYPARWHWFLTDDGTDRYIPEKSHQHWLRDYEN